MGSHSEILSTWLPWLKIFTIKCWTVENGHKFLPFQYTLPTLQGNFFASPIKRRGLFLYSLDLSRSCNLLWPTKWKEVTMWEWSSHSRSHEAFIASALLLKCGCCHMTVRENQREKPCQQPAPATRHLNEATMFDYLSTLQVTTATWVTQDHRWAQAK